MLLTTTEQVAHFCAAQASAPYIAVDTEFMRERTYWSRLCLVQVAGPKPDDVVAIDPLADGINLAPFYELLHNPAVVKVFHAARQDVEIFVHATGRVPEPMFDSQVAAMVCGFGEAASYETLADKLAGVRIDKSSRFTDWSQRPLTERQITYALADVIHLRTIYAKLRTRLEETGRGPWVDEEMAVLTDGTTYRPDPRELWRRLKFRADKPRLRALLRELVAWREEEAQRLNIPRGRVMKDETLQEIAHHAPTTPHELSRTRGLPAGFAEGRQGAGVLAAVERAMALPAGECPAGDVRRGGGGSPAVADLLRVLLRQVSEESGVAARLIASGEDLDALAAGASEGVPALAGWRHELFGATAEALRAGQLALTLRKERVVWFKP